MSAEIERDVKAARKLAKAIRIEAEPDKLGNRLTWYQIDLTTTAQALEQLADQLEEADAASEAIRVVRSRRAAFRLSQKEEK